MELRLVVFNADDLGVSAGTNAGIRAAWEAGLVREASLCVTGAAVEEGAALARQCPGLGVGLHLAMTVGRPLAGGLRGLTDGTGDFLPLGPVLRSCLLRRPEAAAVEAEVRAQVERLRQLGIEPTHLDGHHHVHVFPVVREAVLRVVRDEGIPYLRIPSESARTGRALSARRVLLRRLAAAAGRRRDRPPALPFVGLDLLDRPDYAARFLRTARRLRAPAAEWMVHPRAPDDDFARLDHLGPGAAAHAGPELAALTDPGLVGEVRRLGIRPVCHSEVRGTQAGWARIASGGVGRS